MDKVCLILGVLKKNYRRKKGSVKMMPEGIGCNLDCAVGIAKIVLMLCFRVFMKNLSLTKRLNDGFL